MSAGMIIARSAMWLAAQDAEAGSKEPDADKAMEHLDRAAEAIERAQRALRGW